MHINLEHRLKKIHCRKFTPISLESPDGWIGHIPFADYLISEIKPKIIVELGTHTGNSYFAFCQSVKEHSLETKCFAVDTWEGDTHSGCYDDSVFQKVLKHNSAHYLSFSKLLKMYFDDAINLFEDDSIDLLHIDGLHTYEAVKHDFESWLPKVAKGGLVIFHDISIKDRDFGVWKYWNDLKNKYPINYEFNHSNGLGIIQVKTIDAKEKKSLLNLSALNCDISKWTFELLGKNLIDKFNLSEIYKLNSAEVARNKELAEQILVVFQTLAERDTQLEGVFQTLAEREHCISELKNSSSWKLTKPLRFLKDFFQHIRSTATSTFRNGCISLWQSTLVNIVGRDRIKSLLFLYGFFHKTSSYILWKADRENKDSWRQGFLDRYYADSKTLGNYFVEKLNYSTRLDSSIRFIAFYLPQFHEIRENDEWWGEGFTEWTNVRPATPNFFGHYQPHIPSLELGYYDLLSSDTFPKQIELAKNYGIDGFCFYIYWFNGRRLLEKPLENYLQDKSLDLPFCLCWANESWTRRWDGLEANVLLAQNYSSEDDIDFIKNFSQFFLDNRYIKINGKPVLVIYRPNLFPDMKSTANRWRVWCRANGFGEIYLAYTQSFECVDPDVYGLDGAIEFPPNNSGAHEVTKYVEGLVKSFKGKIFDWNFFPEGSESYKNPGYELFRGVCPGWDNTARKKKSGYIFLNSTPAEYGRWLFNATLDTCKRFTNPDKRIIFINAWNEWAEGAHLEPDQKYGYGYLLETRRAKERYSDLVAPGHSLNSAPKLLILIHAYYLDIFFDILEMIKTLNSIEFDVLITTTPGNYAEIERVTHTFERKVKIVIHQNKGRDVLPFIKELPSIINSGYEFVIKLHTKKSLHRDDGNSWRDELFSNLLSKNCINKNMQTFREFEDVGLIGPSGNVLPMSYYWGSNAKNVTNLSKMMGANIHELEHIPFVAGTMFFARVDALKPLAALNIAEEQFESECGQVDGTLAHAIERLISVSVTSAGYRVISSDLEVNLNFKYAVRTS